MLILSRKAGENVVISVGGKLISVCVVERRNDRLQLAFDADPDVIIHRQEVWDEIQKAKELANEGMV